MQQGPVVALVVALSYLIVPSLVFWVLKESLGRFLLKMAGMIVRLTSGSPPLRFLGALLILILAITATWSVLHLVDTLTELFITVLETVFLFRASLGLRRSQHSALGLSRPARSVRPGARGPWERGP